LPRARWLIRSRRRADWPSGIYALLRLDSLKKSHACVDSFDAESTNEQSQRI